MSDPALTEMREVVPLGQYETVNLIEFVRVNGGYRLFLNSRELPFHMDADTLPQLSIDPTGDGFDVLHLELLVEPGAELRRIALQDSET